MRLGMEAGFRLMWCAPACFGLLLWPNALVTWFDQLLHKRVSHLYMQFVKRGQTGCLQLRVSCWHSSIARQAARIILTIFSMHQHCSWCRLVAVEHGMTWHAMTALLAPLVGTGLAGAACGVLHLLGCA
jgi:hypothetical protein